MKTQTSEVIKGIGALPAFPIVLVTIGHNIMTAGAFHFYSLEPPSVMVGIMPERYTYELINQQHEFGVNFPTTGQIELVRTCGSVSARDVDDKYAYAGVTPFGGTEIETDLILECPVNLECVVVHEVDFIGTHRWYVGEIKTVHIDETYNREELLMFWSGQYRKVGALLKKS